MMTTKAVGYLRTSGHGNVGSDKDSDVRQQLAITGYAEPHDTAVVRLFYDEKVKGADPIWTRPGFSDMLAFIESTPDVRTIIVEAAHRFARDLIVQETGFVYLRDRGITLIAADDPDSFTEETPTKILIRQILGAVAQFEKTSIVAKLRGARQRKKALTGWCEGGKPAPETARTLARSLRADGLSLRAIADQLAQAGFLSPSGRTYGAESIKHML